MNIVFNDLAAQHAKLEPGLSLSIRAVIESSSFIGKAGNPFVEAFEKDFAAYSQAAHCVACANGTDAIELALRALDIGPGDEVVVPAMTWISTAEAVSLAGATPVFADILSNASSIDPDSILQKLTQRTKAILPVHLHGLPADMPAIVQIAKDKGLRIIEDCAQAHGASIGNTPVGSFGDIATYSFFPGKNLGAIGDAGGTTTADLTIAKRLASLRDHGRGNGSDHPNEGRNSRLDGIQAAVLSIKLKHIEAWTEERIIIASRYRKNLSGTRALIAATPEGYRHVYHILSVALPNRDRIQRYLSSSGIQTSIHYERSLPELSAYSRFKYSPDQYPNARRFAQTNLSLPIYPGIGCDKIDYVCEKLIAALSETE